MAEPFAVFDRYSAFTDLAKLKEFSARPLRKSKRVNTLKVDVSAFITHAKKQGWMTEQVPWCSEGFFIDREDRTTALGKDTLHLIGATYIQEAASMLPPMLLDPKPGERILDMAAAPGSKSTQIAAMMQGRGVLVCNDMQEKRLWTLMTALNRLGVMNVAVTKKVGQWFSKNMTEAFDRVLIDAPCTAQGTVRKDQDALSYTSEHGIGKACKLQRELLDAAIHTTKVGGRIVYSTCTLTQEENEKVVIDALTKHVGKLEVVDPRKVVRGEWLEASIEDSIKVQTWLSSQGDYPLPSHFLPLLRLWPQTYDTEGFFCAVLQKTAPTKHPERVEAERLKQEIVPRSRMKDIRAYLDDHYGPGLLRDHEVLLQDKERYWVTTEETLDFRIPAPLYGLGLPFGKSIIDAPVHVDHDIATLRGSAATNHAIDIDAATWQKYLSGQDIGCDPSITGHVLVRYDGHCVGRGRARDGKCKNLLPRWMIQVAR